MGTVDTIIVILKRKNLSQKDLTDHLGLSKNAVTEWKAGRNESWRKYLPQIADFLGVSVNELLGQPPLISYMNLSAQEQDLVALIHKLTPQDQKTLQGIIEVMLRGDAYSVPPAVGEL